MDLSVLQTEFQEDPLTRGYVGMTAAEKLVDLKTAYRLDRLVSTPVSFRTLMSVLTPDEYRQVKGNLTTLAASDILIEDVLKIMSNIGVWEESGVDFGTVATQGMIEQIGGVFGWSAELITKLKNLGYSKKTREVELFPGENLTLSDIINAGG